MIAVAVDARGWDQRGQPVDQFQGREAQLPGAIGLIQAFFRSAEALRKMHSDVSIVITHDINQPAAN
jgi:hypothetical protein